MCGAYICLKYLCMSVIVLLIAVSVLVAGGFLVAFLWSVKSGQMDDDYTPSVRMLFDDEIKDVKQSPTKNKN
jgi:cbb3-type cytochrome oxidase maturation protein